MSDPLFRDVPLGHALELPVLGVPTRFRASDARLLEVVRDTFGDWSVLEGREELLSAESVEVRLWLHGPGSSAGASSQALYRMPEDEQLVVLLGGSLGVADSRVAQATAYVTEALLARPAVLSETLLQALTYSLLAKPPRIAFHAAGIAESDAAVLLHGPGGSGKSTLTWACARRGLRVLSEDVVYLQTTPKPLVWGLPGPLRIPRDSRRFFPELGDDHPIVVVGGREKLIVPRSENRFEPVVESAVVCLLEPGDGRPSMTRVDAETILARAGTPTEPGFDLFATTLRPALEVFARAGGWLLRVGNDPHAAAELVTEMLAPAEASPEPAP